MQLDAIVKTRTTQAEGFSAADWIAVAAFALLGLTVLYALWKSLLSRNSGRQVTRGRESWAVIAGTFLATLGAYAFLVSNSDFPGYVKDILYGVAALVLGYLFFESAWYQNLLVGLEIRIVSKARGHT